MGSVPPEGLFRSEKAQMCFSFTDDEIKLLDEVRILSKRDNVHQLVVHSLMIYKALMTGEPILVSGIPDDEGEIIQKIVKIKMELGE